jgi:pimeloyl-ACP methyl ester carboxylesterase
MKPQYFPSTDGCRLAYRDEGTGLAVICLSGLTRTMEDFDYLIPHLPPLRLIRMDYRGRGASDWSGAASYTIAREGADVLALLDHLGLERAALIGTSRGGMIGLHLAEVARDRLTGLCLVDIGPELGRAGLGKVAAYVGRNPVAASHEDLAARLPAVMPGFENVAHARWLAEARKHYQQTAEGLRITYDPALREIFVQDHSSERASPSNQWPGFDAMAGLPLALIRGANSDLLTPETTAEMIRRRPDMIHAEVPGRAHIPFLDEIESVAVIRAFVKACQ